MIGQRIALAAVEIAGDIESPGPIGGDLVHPIDVEGPAALEQSAPATQIEIEFAVIVLRRLCPGPGGPCEVRRILPGVKAVGDAPIRFAVGEIAPQHPLIRETLGGVHSHASMPPLPITVGEELSTSIDKTRIQGVEIHRVGTAVRKITLQRVLEKEVVPGRFADRAVRLTNQLSLFQDVRGLAVGEIQTHHELGEKRVLNAQDQLVGHRRFEIGIVDVGALQGIGIRRIEATPKDERRHTVHLLVVPGVVVIAVDKEEVGVGVGQRIDEPDRKSAQLLGEAGIARSQKRLTLLTERASGSEAR